MTTTFIVLLIIIAAGLGTRALKKKKPFFVMHRKPSVWAVLFMPVAWLTVLVAIKLEHYDIVKTVSVIAFLQSFGAVWQFYQKNNDENPEL